MTKITSLSALLVALASSTALAADLPRRAAPPPTFSPIPVFTWTGFYIGGNAGYAFTTRESRNRNAAFLIDDRDIGTVGGTFGFNNKGQNGFTGGLQIGANYQFTPGSGFVVGVEADAQYLDAGRRRSGVVAGPGTVLNPNAVFFDPRATAGLEYFGTVRGRLGYAFNNVLLYGTAGLAFGSLEAERGGLQQSQTSVGWTAGVGAEVGIYQNWTAKIEYLYVDLSKNSYTLLPTPTDNALSFGAVRIGVNYHF